MGRVALIGDNSVEYVDKLIDIWNNGDCVVLINPQVPVKMCIQMMLEAGVVKCFVEQKYFERLKELDDGLFKLTSYESESQMVRLLPKEIRNKFRNNYSRDEAVVIYSSGTTGKSKGVILSHFAINTNADAIIDYMSPTEKDCIYIAKPLYHSSTLTGELLVSLKTKMELIIAPTVVPPRYVLNNIKRFSVTIICLNPTLLSMIADEYERGQYDISSLKTIYISGSILNDATYKKAHSIFYFISIYNVYGLSEAGPRVSAQRSGCCQSNSVGKPIKDVEIIIVDEQGTEMAVGEYGIIHVKTTSLFCGYVIGKNKHTSLYKGWFNTGDIGCIDTNGELHIINRLDDVIIIDSHKIYPNEVEKQIVEQSGVKECAVAKIELGSNEFIGCLYVSEKEIERDIKRKLKSKLLVYEIPKLFFRCDTLPRNKNGKVSTCEIQTCLQKYISQE